MKKYNKIVNVIANIFTVLTILGVVAMIVLLCLLMIDWFSFVVSVLSCVIQLVLLWALNSALTRIDNLEQILDKKDIVKSKEIENELIKRNQNSDY